MLIVDDMDPARYHEATHLRSIAQVRERLVTDPRLVAVELAVGSGIILATYQQADSEKTAPS